jgi:hypothetical protein
MVPGMTDESDKPDSLANRTMPIWALVALAALAIGAYGYFVLNN